MSITLVLLGQTWVGLAADKPLELILGDAKHLAASRQRIQSGDAALRPAYDRLMSEAQSALKSGPWTVTAKTLAPPSGDKHDYMSYGPYWWPNPKTTNGLPYVRRDGEVNPDFNSSKCDQPNLARMADAVKVLALAYYFSGEEKFAAHAARLLRAWYLDPATRMNPHLKYGQAIPGITEGRGIGLIDTVSMLPVPDATRLLEPSASWTEEDMRNLKAWFAHFLDWMVTSQLGKDEAAAKNNHGTWYDVQLVTYGLYVGEHGLARRVLEQAGTKRVAIQIRPDGSQPLELERTKSFGYSAMNLRGFLALCAVGKRMGIDLCSYTSPEGGSIRKAVEFMLVYADPAKKWIYPQIKGYSQYQLFPLALTSARLFEDEKLYDVARKLCQGGQEKDLVRLELNW